MHETVTLPRGTSQRSARGEEMIIGAGRGAQGDALPSPCHERKLHIILIDKTLMSNFVQHYTVISNKRIKYPEIVE